MQVQAQHEERWKVRAALRKERRVVAKPVTAALSVRPAATAAPVIDTAALARAAIEQDRKRIRAILCSPEARAREQSAMDLALSTDDDAPSVRRLLATLRFDADRDIDEVIASILAAGKRRVPGDGGQKKEPSGPKPGEGYPKKKPTGPASSHASSLANGDDDSPEALEALARKIASFAPSARRH